MIYNEIPDDLNLYIARKTVQEALHHGRGRLLLNINHDERATIGIIDNLYDLDYGLFCCGRITSDSFLEIVDRAAPKSRLIRIGPSNGLDPDSVIEFLSSTFPGLSLSSRSETENLDETFFNHVSICGAGLRRGTLAVYGRDLDWTVEKFKTISGKEKEHIVQNYKAVDVGGDLFRLDIYDLIANIVDISYIDKRFEKLKYDKKVGGIKSSTYIKASDCVRKVDDVDPAEPVVCEMSVCDVQDDNIRDAETENDASRGEVLGDVIDCHGTADGGSESTDADRSEGGSSETVPERSKDSDVTPRDSEGTGINTIIAEHGGEVGSGPQDMAQPPAQNAALSGAVSQAASERIYLSKDAFDSLLTAATATNFNSRQQNWQAYPVSADMPAAGKQMVYPNGVPRELFNERQYVPVYPTCPDPANMYCHQYRHHAPYEPQYQLVDQYYSKRKRAVQQDLDDDMSFPGDVDYNSMKRRKRCRNEDEYREEFDRNYGKEVLEALNLIKKEILNIRNNNSRESYGNVLDSTTTGNGDKTTEKMSTVNASCVPKVMEAHDSNRIVNINRKLFASALDKIDVQ